MTARFHRRRLLQSAGASALAATTASRHLLANARAQEFQLKYLLGACMYGYMYLGEIPPEVKKVGAEALDIWPKTHGNQREQLEDLGEPLFGRLLKKHDVKLGCITQYHLGPFGLQDEMRLAQRLGCTTIVTGGRGPRGLQGAELKAAVKKFAEQMKPHLAVAKETGVTIAVENHGHNLIQSPDSMKYLAEFSSPNLGIALAPYHLPQDSKSLAALIRDLGNRIEVFYAWQHGHGCMTKLPKKEELLQLPGRGELDFGPLLEALKEIDYRGWTEIFMHPVPRGIPILETAKQVTEEINRSRQYLESRL